MRNPNKIIFLFIITILSIFGCNEKDNEELITNNCPEWSASPSSPYFDPIWHPSGDIIGFNHMPLKEIDYTYGYDCPWQADYKHDIDSMGFWLINADGTNQRRVLPYYLQTPAWSPDGNWIAFSQGAQIFKMPFDGEKFDTANIVQLTFEGRNFHPSWSPNNAEIVYSESICNEELKCGVWTYSLITREYEFLNKYGSDPDWHPSSDSIIFLTNAINSDGADIGDSIWLYSRKDKVKTLFKFISTPNYDNRYLQFSPFGTKIGFISSHLTKGIQLYIINSDGNDLKKITDEGCKNFSWGPDGKHIVYVNYNGTRIDNSKGTLWIINIENNAKRQLTYNVFNLIQ